MAIDWLFSLHCLLAFVAILNPIGAVPLYLGIVSQQDAATARRVTRNATLTVFVVLALFAALGHIILRFFGITLPAFRVGGGILLLIMSVALLQGRMGRAKHAPEEASDLAERESVAIVPLGIPILAGPGSITTSILLAQQARTLPTILALALSIGIATALVWIVFRLAQRLQRVLRQTEIGVVNRVMGLILAAIAVQFMADGLKALFPALGGPPP